MVLVQERERSGTSEPLNLTEWLDHGMHMLRVAISCAKKVKSSNRTFLPRACISIRYSRLDREDAHDEVPRLGEGGSRSRS